MAEAEGTKTEVHPNESAKEAGKKPAAGKGNWIEQHKALAYGGMGLILVVLFLFLRNGGSSASTTGTGTNAAGTNPYSSDIDPATGYIYGSPADISALSGSGSVSATPGATGTTGATGATGATGPAGPSGSSGPNASAQGLTPITPAQAKTLLGATERPFMLNASGTGFAPATSIQSGVTYWAGPMEEQQILGNTGPFGKKASSSGMKVSSKAPITTPKR